MPENLGDAVLDLSTDQSEFDRQLEGAERKVGASYKRMGVVVGGLGVAITGSLALGVNAASDFDQGMREVNSLLGLSEAEFQVLKDEALDLSQAMGINAVESTKALYDAISLGVPRENVFEFMRVASEAAIAGNTDVDTAVKGLASTMNAFGMEASEVRDLADVMFTTVKNGGTTFDELSSFMFQVSPIAASLGVDFREVLSAVATLTKAGVPTAQAMTQIRQVMVEFQKPNEKVNDLLGRMGVVSLPGVTEALEESRDKLAETEAAIEKLNTEGLEASEKALAQQSDALAKNRADYTKAQDQLTVLTLKMGEYTDKTKDSTKAADAIRKARLEETLKSLDDEYSQLSETSIPETSQRMEDLQSKAASLKAHIADLESQQRTAAEGGATLSDTLAEHGLLGTLQTLRAEVAENDEEFQQAFGSVEATNAALGLTGENAEGAASDLVAANDSIGASTAAYEEMEKGAGRQREKAVEQFKVLAIQIGEVLLPIITRLIQKVSGVLTRILEWTEAHPKLTQVLVIAAGALGLILTVLGPLLIILPGIIALVGLLTAVSLPWILAIGAIVIAIAGLIAIGVLLWKNWDKIKEQATKIWDAIKAFFVKTWEAIVGIFGSGWKAIIGILFPPVGLAMLVHRHWDKIKDTVKGIFLAVVDIVKKHWDILLAIIFPAVGLPILIARHWGPISEVIGKVWDMAVHLVKGAVNQIIGLINSVIEAWNGLEFGVGPFTVGVGKFAKTVGPWIFGTPNLPTIPYLGTGGLVTAPTLAVVGDVPEAIIPLDRLGSLGGPQIHIHGDVYGWDDFADKVRQANFEGGRLGVA